MRFTERSSIECVAVIAKWNATTSCRPQTAAGCWPEQFIVPYDEGIHVTISLGATLARKDDTIVSLLRRADQLMYRIKQVGRNRVIADL